MKTSKFIYIIATVLLLTSCGEFLDIKPYGKTIPKTQEEYRALMDEMLNGIDKGETGDEQLVGSYSTASTYEECADNLETNLTIYPDGNYLTTYIGKILSGRQSVYQYLYENIRNCNIILDGYKPDIPERSDSDLLGACYAVRGVAYYQLLRQFCVPAMTADAVLGVPLVTQFNMEAEVPRSTWDETVQQAESDMQRAITYHIDDEMYRFNDDVMTGYLARLYHWTGQWQKAYDCAMQVVENHPLLDSVAYRTMQTTQNGLCGNRLIMGNLLGDGSSGISSVMTTIKARPISTRWLNLFPEGSSDVRYAIAVGNKRRSQKIPFASMRSAELYLIAMEAKAHLADEAGGDATLTKEAFNMLLNLRKLRSPKNYTRSLVAVPDTLNEYIRYDATGRELSRLMYNILRERRKEMYMENGDRFFELKRNGRPRFWVAVKGMKYTTLPYMYTFPLPVNDTYVQTNLIQNPGYDEVE